MGKLANWLRTRYWLIQWTLIILNILQGTLPNITLTKYSHLVIYAHEKPHPWAEQKKQIYYSSAFDEVDIIS